MASKLQTQRGVSMLGVLFVIIVLAIFGMVGLKVIPTYVEYRAVDKAVLKARTVTGPVTEVRKSFTSSAIIDDITSIQASDLEITKEGNETVISYAYTRKIPLVGPSSLVIDYAGTTKGR